jgi:hypothetical protein
MTKVDLNLLKNTALEALHRYVLAMAFQEQPQGSGGV